MDLPSLQAPLKQRYRDDATTALITLSATATSDEPMSCSVDLGRAIHAAEAHAGVGGPGTGACSGDLLLGALAACAQITCSMVAASQGVPVRHISVRVDGGLDLRGTLGISRETPVGFGSIRVHFDIDAPEATEQEMQRLRRATEQYCVVVQTLLTPPEIEVAGAGAAAQA